MTINKLEICDTCLWQEVCNVIYMHTHAKFQQWISSLLATFPLFYLLCVIHVKFCSPLRYSYSMQIKAYVCMFVCTDVFMYV